VVAEIAWTSLTTSATWAAVSNGNQQKSRASSFSRRLLTEWQAFRFCLQHRQRYITASTLGGIDRQFGY